MTIQLYNVTDNGEPFISNMTKKECFGTIEMMRKCRVERGLTGAMQLFLNLDGSYSILLDDKKFKMERANG